MKHTQGTLGRVFVLRFEDGDTVLKEIERFCRKFRVKCGVCLFLGSLREGEMAAGPRKAVVPPRPNMVGFRDGWEAMGMATIFSGRNGPQAHIHSSMGKGRKVLTGCVRGKSSVFLVLEAVLWEIKGVRAAKDIDPATGLNLLTVGRQ